jgi:hypothetical protein
VTKEHMKAIIDSWGESYSLITYSPWHSGSAALGCEKIRCELCGIPLGGSKDTKNKAGELDWHIVCRGEDSNDCIGKIVSIVEVEFGGRWGKGERPPWETGLPGKAIR